MEFEAVERLQAELELLLAMYPESLSYSPKARELKYLHRGDGSGPNHPAVLLLRLPDTYPLDGSPEIISATGHCKEDLRSATKAAFSVIETPAGEEVLDALLLAFRDLVSSLEDSRQVAASQATTGQSESEGNNVPTNRTVVIWLHHLLNTNKRKLALNPSIAGSRISGITKPGYPGALIFSGERDAVDAHVAELRNQRWQAFQIRYDSGDGEVWRFKHGAGIREVESMSDVVQSIVDPDQKEVFLGYIGVK
jgi:hypothetical protein